MAPATVERMTPAERIVSEDLEYITREGREEFASLSGKRVLIAGGAGFLGYYLVQAPLHWNRHNPGSPPISVTVLDNFIRGVPSWLTALEGDPNLRLLQHDITNPLPADLGDIDVSDPRGLDRLADLLPASIRSRRWTPTSTGCASCSSTASRRSERGKPVEGILFYSSSEIYGDPTPENIPTPETYRGNVSCTGPRACYDESKRYGETLCVNFAQQHGLPIKVARPFNNYGPGLKITDGRVIPDFARNILDGTRHRHALRRLGEADVLLRRRRGRRLLQDPGEGAAGRGLQHRRRDAGDLDDRARRAAPSRSAGSCSATRAGSSARRAPTRTTWSTTRTAAARSSPRRARSSATTRR